MVMNRKTQKFTTEFCQKQRQEDDGYKTKNYVSNTRYCKIFPTIFF